MLAETLAGSGDHESAARLYAAAAEALEGSGTPLSRQVHTQWAELLERLGRADEALAVVKRALQSESPHCPQP